MADARPPDPPTLWLWRAAIILGWALILSGVGLFVWECLLWLHDGSWSRATFADLWGSAPLGGAEATPGWTDMRGLHYILYSILHWWGRVPISVVLVLLGLLVAWVGNGMHERVEQSLVRMRRRGRTP